MRLLVFILFISALARAGEVRDIRGCELPSPSQETSLPPGMELKPFYCCPDEFTMQPPIAGYGFVCIADTAEPYSRTMQVPIGYYPENFTPTCVSSTKYTLTVTKDGTGGGNVNSNDGYISNCTSVCSQLYSPATNVMLTEAHNTDTIFTGWSGECSGNGSCAVTMNKNVNVTATFTALPFGVLVHSVGPLSAGVVASTPSSQPFPTCPSQPSGTDCSQGYQSGDGIQITATAYPGFTFGGWSGPSTGGNCSGNMCNFTMNGSGIRDVTATFY